MMNIAILGTIFVGNLPFNATSTEQKLMEWFIGNCPEAKIEALNIVHDKRTGKVDF